MRVTQSAHHAFAAGHITSDDYAHVQRMFVPNAKFSWTDLFKLAPILEKIFPEFGMIFKILKGVLKIIEEFTPMPSDIVDDGGALPDPR